MKKLLLLTICTQAFAGISLDLYKQDEKSFSKEYNIEMSTGKFDGVRYYQGVRKDEIKASVEKVLKSAIDFENRCNNEYADKRIYQDKKMKCKHHNKNLVESKIIRKLKPYKKEEYEIDRFVVKRRVFTRDEFFTHNDLIRVYKTKGSFGKSIYRVTMKMMGEEEAKKLVESPEKRNSVMKESFSTFLFIEKDKKSTTMKYTYTTTTDHWLLNKSIAISRFFDGMAKSIDSMFASVVKNL